MSEEETYGEFNRLISRYLSGELRPEEIRDFEDLLQNDLEKKAQVEQFRKIWDGLEAPVSDQKYDLDSEWMLMKEQIPELSAENPSGTRRGLGSSLLFYTYRLAAILVVGLLLGLGWIYATRIMGSERITAHKQPVEVLLEDGTHIIINRDSRISYKKNFATTGRKVLLTGEAWFDVAKDSLRPFVIEAGPAMVEVLGTSFNVNAYKKNSTVEITVESGMVALTAIQEKQAEQEQIVLQAGNSGTYHKQKQELVLIPRADPNRIAWKTRDLYFNASSLQEVVDLVNQVYDAQLHIGNENLAQCPITVTFSDQSLDAILNVLQVTLDLELFHEGEIIRLDGAGCTQ